eukprot:CAMPEP_0202961940 /NCGR_PEP_ID=MMETSP1396-20130829/6037_1 /ASSEMBLY_ACC=CAM_ASM_000872 /TAXON_ID= /ORGANISM="Pseudokeronopsis sp., Strain Brazil" /LENGTH=75 /DNA_ID=CAMNT_0049682173 /DNA_START=581 /DNA_END=808 /DNA_ORIENTATION=+
MQCPPEVKDNVVLVGNKSDLVGERQVKQEEGIELKNTLGLLDYFETSAQDNLNVDLAFYRVAIRAFEIEKQVAQT